MLSHKGRITSACKSSLSCSMANREGSDPGESPTRNYLLPKSLQGTKCEVPVDTQAADFSACHVSDRAALALWGLQPKGAQGSWMFSRHQASSPRAALSCGHLWQVEIYCST